MNAHESPASVAARIGVALRRERLDQVSVEVISGCIYLRGVAGCYDKKRRAAQLAAAVAPESCIENEIRVAQMAFADEAHLADEVLSAIADDLGEGALERVTVTTNGGVIVLKGRARDDGERHRIEQSAWAASRAARVVNQLEVDAPEVPDDEVAAALEAYIQRAMNVAPGTIEVQYRSGVASLSGRVSSTSQGEAIEDLVRWHDRVTDVENRLRVEARPVATRRAGSSP